MADKFLQHDTAGGLREIEGAATGGAGNENKIAALDATGRLDPTMLPTGLGAETVIVPAFGTLAASNLVNLFNDAGTIKARQADNSSAATFANGFVLNPYTAGQDATVYFGGLVSGLAGLTPGIAFLHNVPGASHHVVTTTSGAIVQKVGLAINATTLYFEPKEPILLA